MSAVALGMTAAREWNGREDADNGYIIVKTDGEVLAYHLFSRDAFETYLLNNTRFEKPSQDRHHFGKVYVEDSRKFLNLNLQIRFKS